MALQEQIYTSWKDGGSDFIIDPQQPQIRDLMMIQSGYCEVYKRSDWAAIIHDKIDEEERHSFKRYKAAGHLIGFKSLVSGTRSDCVIRPEAVNPNGPEKYRIVSILKIPEEKWEAIWKDAFEDEEKRQEFVQKVIEDDFFDDWNGALNYDRAPTAGKQRADSNGA